MGFIESLVAATAFVESCPFGAMFIWIVFNLAWRFSGLLLDVFALIWHKFLTFMKGGEK